MESGRLGIDKTFVRRGKIADIGNDFEYWQSKTPVERLEAAQQIRQEYNDWKYGPGQRLQRVWTKLTIARSPHSSYEK